MSFFSSLYSLRPIKIMCTFHLRCFIKIWHFHLWTPTHYLYMSIYLHLYHYSSPLQPSRVSTSMLFGKSMDVGLDPLLFIFYSMLFRKNTTPIYMLFRKSMLKGPTILLFNLNKNISTILRCIKNFLTTITN